MKLYFIVKHIILYCEKLRIKINQTGSEKDTVAGFKQKREVCKYKDHLGRNKITNDYYDPRGYDSNGEMMDQTNKMRKEQRESNKRLLEIKQENQILEKRNKTTSGKSNNWRKTIKTKV